MTVYDRAPRLAFAVLASLAVVCHPYVKKYQSSEF